MAVGFTPKYIEAYPLDDLPQNHFLVLATEAVRELKWQLNYLSQTGLIAYTDNGMFGWNASYSYCHRKRCGHPSKAHRPGPK
jgi:rhomboid protease GluP